MRNIRKALASSSLVDKTKRAFGSHDSSSKIAELERNADATPFGEGDEVIESWPRYGRERIVSRDDPWCIKQYDRILACFDGSVPGKDEVDTEFGEKRVGNEIRGVTIVVLA